MSTSENTKESDAKQSELATAGVLAAANVPAAGVVVKAKGQQLMLPRSVIAKHLGWRQGDASITSLQRYERFDDDSDKTPQNASRNYYN